MEVLEAFQFNDNQYNVRIFLDNDSEPWFHATDIAMILDLKNIHSSLQAIDPKYKCLHQDTTSGGNQNVSFIAEEGVYHMMFTSRKPAAKIFRDWVLHVIKQIRKNGRYELLQENATQKQILDSLMKEHATIKHNEKRTMHFTLLDMYNNKRVVYFGIVGYIDGKILLKIGYTDDIRTRSKGHEADYGEFSLVKVMEISAHEEFERWLHKHDYLCKHKYRHPIKLDGSTSIEVYLLDDHEQQTVFNIASRKVYSFRHYDVVQQKIQLIKLFNDLNKLKEDQQLTEKLAVLDTYLDEVKIDPSEVDPVLLLADHRKYTQARGPKVQAYNDNGTLYKTYISIKSAKIAVKGSNTQLKKAIEECNIYCGYRWLSLPRAMPDDTIQALPPTRDISRKSVKSVMIAALNLNETKIEKVFANQRMVMKEYQVKAGTVSSAIKRHNRSNGFYWVKWDDVSQELKDEFLEHNSLPKPFIRSNAKPINQYHPVTNVLIATYPNVTAVLDEYKMGRKKLFDAIETNMFAKGYRWRYADDVQN